MDKEFEFRPYDKVLVRDYDEQQWRPTLFAFFDANEAFPYMAMETRRKQCIPYEGNEHLVGTTFSLQTKRWRAKKGEPYFIALFGEKGFERRVLRDVLNLMRMLTQKGMKWETISQQKKKQKR